MELISLEQIAGINFFLNIIETGVVAVGDDGLGKRFELLEIIDNTRAEEGVTIGKRGFVDDDLGTFGLHAFHDSLNGRLAEIVAVRFHRQAIDTNNTRSFVGRILIATIVIIVVASHSQNTVGNEILAGAI